MTPEHWEQYKRLVFWFDRRMCNRFKVEHGTYIGALYAALEKCLASFDFDRTSSNTGRKVKFSTYYGRAAWREIAKVNALDKETLSLAAYLFQAKKEDIHCTNVNFAEHETQYHLYRPPGPDDDWADEIMEVVGGKARLEEMIRSWVPEREYKIIVRRYIGGETLSDIGNDLGMTKERVRQLEARGLKKIKDGLRNIERFQRLFVN